MSVSLPRLGNFTAIASSDKFSAFVFSNPYNVNITLLDVVTEILKVPSFFKIIFFFFSVQLQ